MSLMLLFFSGTGNSRYVAKLLADALDDEVCDLNDLVGSDSPVSFESEKPFVVVCPTYCYAVPSPVKKLLSSASFGGSTSMYFIMTCGAGIGGAGYLNSRICEKAGLKYMGTAKLVMPDNYLVMYEPSTFDEASALIESLPARLEPLSDAIKSGASLSGKGNAVSGAVSSVGSRLFESFVGKPSKFFVSDDCVSCGLCEKNCPLHCITLNDGIPQWKSGCIHCLSCLCGCPNNAIDYGKSTKGRRRHYLYPDGTLKK